MSLLYPTRIIPALLCAASLLLIGGLGGCKPKQHVGKRLLNIPIQADVGTLDPMLSDSFYDSWTSAVVCETLLQYHYLKRPLELEPLLLKEMPKVSKDGLLYTFTLKKGIKFHDCPCFPGGKGREMTSADVLYSIKRMANRAHKPSPRGWWVYEKRIVGFDKFRDNQYKCVMGKAVDKKQALAKAKATFDAANKSTPKAKLAATNAYKVTKENIRKLVDVGQCKAHPTKKKAYMYNVDGKVAGLRKLGKYRFQIQLRKPFPQLLYILAFQKTAIVPREAVEYFSKKDRGGFSKHPIGTGPYIFTKWRKGVRVSYKKNPNYRHSTYPTDGFSKADIKAGRHLDKGKALPMADIMVVQIFQQYQPSWLKFRVGDLNYIRVSAEYWDLVYTKEAKLRYDFKQQKITTQLVGLLDFIYTGFNFRDPIVGGYSKRARYLRKALRYAYDLDEINARFYNGRAGLYTGAIPPGLEGHVAKTPKPNLKLARKYLAMAGYPNGQGLPILKIATSTSNQAKEREDVLKRQFSKIGVRVRYDISTFPQLSRKLRSGKAQMFSLAWGSDYPDAENNLMLFYGPNVSPGPNSWNYDNPVYNKLYAKARVLSSSPARTKLYEQMNQILIDDVAFLGSIARTRYYIKNPTLKNFRPDETMTTFWKYLKPPIVK